MPLDPTEALYKTVMSAVSCVLEASVHDQTVIPDPNEHVAPFRKFAPARFTDRCAWPCEPELGFELERAGGGVVVTVTVRTGGLGSVFPALSVTVRVAVYTPAVEKVTGPGLACALAFGLPPRMDHEYAAMDPLGAVPVPAKLTDCPGRIVTSPGGLVIAPDGGGFGVKESWTNLAIDGTPALLIKKSM
jgi:hypothetical protein